MNTKLDKISSNNRQSLYKKIITIFSFLIKKRNNKSNLNKERLEKPIDEYFKNLDEYRVVD